MPKHVWRDSPRYCSCRRDTSDSARYPLLSQRIAIYAVVVLVGVLSVRPIINMLSANQMMNFSFNPVHLVNTYGAFGSITRQRNEIVVEGTDDEMLTSTTTWREYWRIDSGRSEAKSYGTILS